MNDEFDLLLLLLHRNPTNQKSSAKNQHKKFKPSWVAIDIRKLKYKKYNQEKPWQKEESGFFVHDFYLRFCSTETSGENFI